tara:strand:- start:1247 stop:2269 length:1023 start_codon:yes stop_codon:yes gene_type:complete
MKKIILVIILLFILFLSFFTVNSEFRRKIMTYVFVTHDYYQLKTVTSDIQKRDFTTASNKLMKYINISKKLAKDSSYMTGGIYKAVETVINRAILQDDFNKLEKVLAELVKIEPNSYKPNVWLARAYSDNKLEESLVLLEKAIALSPSQEDAYRELLRISQFHNIKKTIKKYCNSYSNSQLSGLRSSTYASLFNSNNLRRFAMSINDNNFFYTNDGIVLNQIQNYEFVLNSKTNINNINLFFSLLPGIKLEIKKVELLSNNKKILIPNNKTFITSRNSYFINDDDKISIFFTNLSDEIIRINFNENFYNNNKILFNNVEKINLVMEFNKLNLSNITLCSN